MCDRLYLPTFADLIDRLSICLRKYALIESCRETMIKEIKAIIHDISLFKPEISGELIELILTIGLLNNLIWENEAAARQGKEQDAQLLVKTHGMNALRQKTKNALQKLIVGEEDRIEPKHEYMAEKFAEIELSFL